MDIDSLGPLETVECSLCGCNQTLPITSQKWFGAEFCIVRCAYCNLIFTNPRPTSEWRKRFYDHRYNPIMSDLGRDFPYQSLKGRELASDHILEFTKNKVSTNNKLLDIGCAGGQFVKKALEHGFEATGIEPSPGALSYAEEHYGLKLIKGEAGNIPIPDNTYDIVTLLHVFEHFRKPIETLQEIKRVLKPGGMMFIETPNCLRFYLLEKYFALFKSTFFKIHNKTGPKWEKEIPWYPFDHYYNWTSDTLLTALRKTGFKQGRSHILSNFSSTMPENGHFPVYHKIYVNLVKSLFVVSSERFNLWGVLIVTGTKL